MEYDDPLFMYFMTAVMQYMEIGSKMGVVGFIPWLKNVLPRSWTGVNRMEESLENVMKYFKVVLTSPFILILFNVQKGE